MTSALTLALLFFFSLPWRSEDYRMHRRYWMDQASLSLITTSDALASTSSYPYLIVSGTKILLAYIYIYSCHIISFCLRSVTLNWLLLNSLQFTFIYSIFRTIPDGLLNKIELTGVMSMCYLAVFACTRTNSAARIISIEAWNIPVQDSSYDSEYSLIFYLL